MFSYFLLAFLLPLLVVGAFVVGWMLANFRLPSDQHPCRPSAAVLNPEEHHFYDVLCAAIRPEYLVFPKVRFDAIVKPGPGRLNRLRHDFFSYRGVNEVDFVTCDPHDLTVKGVIELDGDGAHRGFDLDSIRHRFFETALDSADIPLMRFEVNKEYAPEILRQQILATLNRSSYKSFLKVGLAGPTVWVRVEGRGTFQNSAGLRQVAERLIERGHRQFIVDLGACELMDSTFLGTLTDVALRLKQEASGELVFVRASKRNLGRLVRFGLEGILAAQDSTPTPPPAELAEVATNQSREEKRENIIAAHEALVRSNPHNAILYQDALDFLKGEDPEKAQS
jgi:anti-anti-sigma regulatory factor